MIASLIVLVLSLQVATDAPAADPNVSVRRPEAARPSAEAPPADAAPALDPAEHFKRNALRNFWSMNFRELGHEEWTFLGMYYGARALLVVTLMTLAWTLSGWAATALRVALLRVKFDETLTIFLAKLLRYSILALVAMTCLSYFGIETTGFAAVIGAAGLAIGLAFQGTLSNFAAGAMLLIFRPYKVGDLVNVAGHLGKVAEIELFTTTIDTPDRRRIIVPNSSIYGSVIENVAYHSSRRVEVPVRAAYAADIDETRAALDRAMRSVPGVLSHPAPEAFLSALGASSVEWTVRAFASREQFLEVKQALIRAVKMELERSGIVIPLPQLDVHFDSPAA